ncbi:hypothetical protein Tco_1508790 [Tanacetum coccineum]
MKGTTMEVNEWKEEWERGKRGQSVGGGKGWGRRRVRSKQRGDWSDGGETRGEGGGGKYEEWCKVGSGPRRKQEVGGSDRNNIRRKGKGNSERGITVGRWEKDARRFRRERENELGEEKRDEEGWGQGLVARDEGGARGRCSVRGRSRRGPQDTRGLCNWNREGEEDQERSAEHGVMVKTVSELGTKYSGQGFRVDMWCGSVTGKKGYRSALIGYIIARGGETAQIEIKVGSGRGYWVERMGRAREESKTGEVGTDGRVVNGSEAVRMRGAWEDAEGKLEQVGKGGKYTEEEHGRGSECTEVWLSAWQRVGEAAWNVVEVELGAGGDSGEQGRERGVQRLRWISASGRDILRGMRENLGSCKYALLGLPGLWSRATGVNGPEEERGRRGSLGSEWERRRVRLGRDRGKDTRGSSSRDKKGERRRHHRGRRWKKVKDKREDYVTKWRKGEYYTGDVGVSGWGSRVDEIASRSRGEEYQTKDVVKRLTRNWLHQIVSFRGHLHLVFVFTNYNVVVELDTMKKDKKKKRKSNQQDAENVDVKEDAPKKALDDM